MKSNSLLNQKSGFTLIELLIVIFLMVIISAAIYRATEQTFQLRNKLSVEGDFYQEIRLAMGIMEHDIQLMFTTKSFIPAVKGKDGSGSTSDPNDPNQPASSTSQDSKTNINRVDIESQSEYWGPIIHPSGIRVSYFTGTDKHIQFVSNSNLRVYENSQESVFLKVKYEFQRDKNLYKLVRIVNTNAFDVLSDESENTTHTYPLLHNIEEYKWTYYDEKNERWVNAWDMLNADFTERYPAQIKLEIKVKGSEKLTFTGSYVFKTEIPIDEIMANF